MTDVHYQCEGDFMTSEEIKDLTPKQYPLSFTDREWRIVLSGLGRIVGSRIHTDEAISKAHDMFDAIEEMLEREFYSEEE